MPIPLLEAQARFREAGRIRLGEKGPRGVPRKLKTFRLTSARRDLLDAAAKVYGGTVTPWPDGPDGDKFQVQIESPLLDVMVPPGQVVSQWFEMWAAGGCARRCDGETMTVPVAGEACQCPADHEKRNEMAADGQACKPYTRVSVFLSRIPDLALWRVTSTGFYAAVEFAPMATALVALATKRGAPVPAQLGIGQRRVKRPNKPPHEFVVPEWIVGDTTAAFYAPELGPGLTVPERPMLPAGQPAIPPPPALPADPRFGSIVPGAGEAEQAEQAGDWFGGEPPAAESAAPAENQLAVILREKAASSTLTGPRTDPQKTALQAIFAPVGMDATAAGMAIVFGLTALKEITAAQAQAVIDCAVSADFGGLWTEMVATTTDRGSAVEQIA